MKIQCDDCERIFNDSKISYVKTGDYNWGFEIRIFLCDKCNKIQDKLKKNKIKCVNTKY